MITKEPESTLPQQTTENEEKPERESPVESREIEFVLDDETIMLNPDNITILKSFLETATNREQAIDSMKLEKLTLEKLYLLAFNCKNETCSYLLLDRNEPNRSLLLDDMVTVKEVLPSTEKTKLLFLFENDHKNTWKILQLDQWGNTQFVLEEPLPEKEAEDLHIISGNWIDDTTVHIEYQLEADSTIYEGHLIENTESLFDLES